MAARFNQTPAFGRYFVLDKGIKNAMRVTQILKEVLPDESTNDDADTTKSDPRPAHEIAHEELRGPQPPVTETNPKERNDNEGAE